MVSRFFSWIKAHPAATILVLVLVYLFGRTILNSLFGISLLQTRISPLSYEPSYSEVDAISMSGAGSLRSMSLPPMEGSTNPNVPTTNRKVATNTTLSLLVSDVRTTTTTLKTAAESLGGFLVNSSLAAPEEATSGNLSVRIPTSKLDSYLETVRTKAVRVVSENITGYDVTDQYKDIESRLTTLRSTKATFESFMARATTIDEILRVQQSIFSVQDQIDALIGQQTYIENTTATALVTLYLSTDELSLPYAPSAPWRPTVVFKTAVRALTLTLRQVGSLAIWLAVYSVLWLPALGLIYLVSHRAKKHTPQL